MVSKKITALPPRILSQTLVLENLAEAAVTVSLLLTALDDGGRSRVLPTVTMTDDRQDLLITLSVQRWTIGRDVARRAGPSASAETCRRS